MAKNAKRKNRRKKVDALHIFLNASGFYMAGQVLNEYPGHSGWLNHKDFLLWPFLVNEAFGLELFIKTLHRVRRRTPQGIHGILALFNALSKADRKNLEKRYIDKVKMHPGYAQCVSEGMLFDLESVLRRANTMFTKGRYWHEGELPERDSIGTASNAGIGPLCDAFRSLLFELNPDWDDALQRFRLQQPGNKIVT